MRRFLLVGVLALSLSVPAKADLFGGDVAVLSQILIQAIQQLIQLKKILDATGDAVDVIKQINNSLSTTLNNLKNIQQDPGIFKDWKDYNNARGKLENLFGKVPHSSEEKIQNDADQGVAEAITNNNRIYEYAENLDKVAEEIKSTSGSASPGGAQRLTAHALAVIIQALDQLLRAQATNNKLKAHEMALDMYRDKEATRSFMDSTSQLSQALKTEKADFPIPRF